MNRMKAKSFSNMGTPAKVGGVHCYSPPPTKGLSVSQGGSVTPGLGDGGWCWEMMWSGPQQVRCSFGGGYLQPAVHQGDPTARGKGGSGSPAHISIFMPQVSPALQRRFSFCSNIRYSHEWPSWVQY